MAKLSANGFVVGEIQYINKVRRYMSNKKILENYGTGWKVYGKVKDEYSPGEACRIVTGKQTELLNSRPALAKYRAAMLKYPISRRWKLAMSLNLLGNDVDGIWSELNDAYDGFKIDLKDIIRLSELREAAINEGKAKETEQMPLYGKETV